MKIVDHCLEIYKNEQNQISNGIPCSEENVKRMLETIRYTLIEGLNKNPNNIIPEINQLYRSNNDLFEKTNPADIISLIFEVIVEQNRNPNLWRTPGDGGIRGEIKSILRTIFYGPNQLANDPASGVLEKNYQDAKLKLTELLKKRYSLFR